MALLLLMHYWTDSSVPLMPARSTSSENLPTGQQVRTWTGTAGTRGRLTSTDSSRWLGCSAGSRCRKRTPEVPEKRRRRSLSENVLDLVFSSVRFLINEIILLLIVNQKKKYQEKETTIYIYAL